jgi:ABC-type glycerol-3-phosphate transport system substrate-binding protein
LAKSITVWTGSGTVWDYDAAHVSAFEKQTGITVNVVELPSASALTKVEIGLRSHNSSFAMYETPTSVSYYNVKYGAAPTGSFVKNPKLTPASEDYSDINPGLYRACTVGGKVYCLPLFTDGAVLAYNTKLLAKAGITSPPNSWAAVETDADQITQKTGVPGWCTRGSEASAAIADTNTMLAYFLPYNKNNKGFMVSPTWHSLLDTPQAVAAYTEYEHLETKDAPPAAAELSYTNCLSLFEEGKVAMDWDGAGVVVGPGVFNPPAGSPIRGAVAYDAIPCPKATPDCMPGGPWGTFINSYASQADQDSAWLYSEYLTSASYLKALVANQGDPWLAVRLSETAAAMPGVPPSLLKAIAYEGSHFEPNCWPPTSTFDASQNDYQIAISDIAAGGNVQKELAFAASGMDATFKAAGLLK